MTHQQRTTQNPTMQINIPHNNGEAQEQPSLTTPKRTSTNRALSTTFTSAAQLAKRLPTGTLMVYKCISPIVTAQGECDAANRVMSYVLIALCALSSFLLSFTDTYKDKNGTVYHGFATFNGLWVIDGSIKIPPNEAEKYKIGVIDFVHGFMTILVFAAFTLSDKNMVGCFVPSPSKDGKTVIELIPVVIGLVCGLLFLLFPTNRHGIGFPLTTQEDNMKS